ncbi:pseudouridine synthase [Streptomyces paromomycinus]|uniref:Pseudouridine synthase n=1 Tax=Streptomyces paromomycinus TaxID=92743 RepID=A0A401WC66_STREY|nr:pseudouridine synthase [Streptomyces paromomycinus]GCD46859.1 pseudouridine synthase [Streptomyces paromomycinus]
MRSSGRNNRDTGRGNYRGAGNKKDEKQQRAGRPRPEERRYDVGEGGPGRGDGGGRGGSGGRGGGQGGGQGGRGGSAGRGGAPDRGEERRGRGAAARGGAKGGPRTSPKSGGKPGGKGPQQRGRGQAPARPREYDAQVEERNRARHSKPQIKTPKTFGDQEGERLQKVLARAGMGSRRACEELIDQARVEVNGQIVMEQGVRVDPEKDEVKVDGLTVATQSYLFFALNKPAGVVSTMEDPDGRQCLGDYVTNRETRLFHVGRLDTETEGIILLTNHGELAHRLTHPRYGVKKTYLAAIQGPLPRDLGKQLKDGIQLEDGYARADHFRVVENTGKNYLVEVSLHEGRKHIVRRMLAEAGFPVDKLVRTAFGPIALGDQKSGWLRRMTNTEVGMLMREVEL